MTDLLHETIAEALSAIREEVGPLTKDAQADTGKYTYTYLTLPTLIEKVDPILAKHGVFIRHQLNGSVLRHELWFNNELKEVYDIDLPNPQATAQGLGSAITYLRRYDTITTLGLISEDDDGAAASKPRPAPTIPRDPPGKPVAAPSTGEQTIGADF